MQDVKELKIVAKKENLDQVQKFVQDYMTEKGFNESDKIKADVVVEEIFVNICNYAYDGNVGSCTIQQSFDDNKIIINFIDNGKEYNPLKKEDPDISLSADDRPIGGLGIYMTKKMMDNVTYEYKNNQNKLTITKGKLKEETH